MNPYGYNERWMHSQRDPHWDTIHLGYSDATMHAKGCYVTVCAYLCSRTLNRDVTPGELVAWLNKNGGFDMYGRLIWDSIRRFTNGKLWMASTWNPVGARFTARLVNFAGQTHLVVELKNPTNGKVDIIFDPWKLPSEDPVQAAWIYPKVLGHLYFKVA